MFENMKELQTPALTDYRPGESFVGSKFSELPWEKLPTDLEGIASLQDHVKALQSEGSSFHLPEAGMPEVGNRLTEIHWSPEAMAAEQARIRVALPEWLTLAPDEPALLAGTKDLPSPEYDFPASWGKFEWPTETQSFADLQAQVGRWNLATTGRTTMDWAELDRLSALAKSPGLGGLGVEEGIGSTIKLATNGGALMLSPAGAEAAEAVAKAAETLKIAEL